MVVRIVGFWFGSCPSLDADVVPVGAHEHREASIAVYQTDRHRCFAVLVSSYRKVFQIKGLRFV
jgi:hypothetical protein